MGGIADAKTNLAGNIAGHAAVGCLSATMSGGNCGAGALSAGIADYATLNMPTVISSANNVALNTAYLSIVGGATSVIAGGKFANGAETAAFGYLFNCVMHECIAQGAIGAAKTLGGVLTVTTGATLCGTTGVGCLAGAPMIAFGASDAAQGTTMVIDAVNGATSAGLNPLKAVFIGILPNAGASTYDVMSLVSSVGSLAAQAPMYIGVTDGIGRAGSLFGLTTSRWDAASAFANSVTGQAGQMLNRASLAGSALWKAYGLSKDGGQ